MEDIISRFTILAIIFSVFFMIKLVIDRKNRNISKNHKIDREMFPLWKPGKESIMFFTNDSCVECEKLQKPAINELKSKNTQVYTIDAAEHTKLADYFRILTVPTTIILDNQGIPQFINQGYTNERILSEQLAKV